MTVRNPVTDKEKLDAVLDQLKILQEVVSDLAAQAQRQEDEQVGRLTLAQAVVEERLHRALIDLYQQFDNVRGFAVGKHLDETRVFVLLRMELYDGLLMERLIEAEGVLEEKFPDFCLLIRHIPVGEIDVKEFVSSRGTLIWQRDSV